MRNNNEISGYDWVTIGLWWTLIFCGWLMIFAVGYVDADSFTTLWDLEKNYGKQLLWIAVGLSLVGIIQLIEVRIYETFSPFFYGAAILLLVGVLFTTPINGATSWFPIGPFRFQPSEFGKVASAMMLSYFLSMPNNKVLNIRTKIQAIGIIFLPVILVLLQGDAGSTHVYISLFLVLFLAGMNAWIYALGLLVAALSIGALLYDTTWWLINLIMLLASGVLIQNWKKNPLWLFPLAVLSLLFYFYYEKDTYTIITISNAIILVGLLGINTFHQHWQLTTGITISLGIATLYTSSVNYIVNNVLQSHQQDRIWVWLRPEKCDPLGALYNLEQSKFAIGSGGWSGKGFLQGERTKLDYVPEQSTDFIFCTVGEEWGFLGTSFIIIVFFALIFRVFLLASKQRSTFAKFYAYGVGSILFFHVFVNVGMTVGLVPIIGIPLPFISYGGSSLMSFSILMGILIKLDSSRLSGFR